MGLLNFLFTRNDSVAAYAEYIQRCLQNGASEIIPNSSPEHAAVIIREFVKAAKSQIHIFCGHLSYSVYGNLVSLFQEAFEKNVDVRIVVFQEKVDDCSLALAQVLKAHGAIRSLAGNFPSGMQDVPHFSIFDGATATAEDSSARYRLEISDEDKRAIVSLLTKDNVDSQRASKLNQIFEKLWENATELRIETLPEDTEK